jgi:5-methylcytosine-specific restriction endonuclease McrBC regulatory subunit McrC
VLRLVEYQTKTVRLTAAEAAEIARLTVGTRDGDGRPRVIQRLTPTATPHFYDLQPGPYVGRFQLLSGRVVEVAGRFPFHDLATLLGLGRSAALLDEVAAPGSGGYSLVDLIALAFIREAERIAGQGLVKAYQRRAFTRPPYPGVPSATLHLKVHAGRPDRLATSANRLTSDIPLNQLVANAHRRLTALIYPDARLGARVRSLDPVFHGITRLSGRPGVISAVPARYREIERLARLILDDRSTLPTGGGVSGVSVMFDMTRIWENYVGAWLRHRSPGMTVAVQQPIVLTDSGQKRTGVADFVLHQGGEAVAVYDAKYRPWQSTPSTDEIYQLFTYAQRLGVSKAALVYPAAETRRATTTVGPVSIESWAVPIEALDQPKRPPP